MLSYSQCHKNKHTETWNGKQLYAFENINTYTTMIDKINIDTNNYKKVGSNIFFTYFLYSFPKRCFHIYMVVMGVKDFKYKKRNSN